MKDSLDKLKQRILSEGVLDGEDQHHEFVTGVHGRKIDMDKIKTASDFYEQWIDELVDFIENEYDARPDMIIGVANGANRLALSLAARMGNGIVGLTTEKETLKSSQLHPSVNDFISSYKPAFVLVVEDVGTTGSTSTTAANKVKEAGAERVEVLNFWQRSEHLTFLEDADIPHKAVIKESMPSYEPDACEYCNAGSKFIPHGTD